MAHNVFISYSSKDKTIADTVQQEGLAHNNKYIPILHEIEFEIIL